MNDVNSQERGLEDESLGEGEGRGVERGEGGHGIGGGGEGEEKKEAIDGMYSLRNESRHFEPGL